MSKHHWTSQKITTVRESIDDTKLTQVVHYITKDRTMALKKDRGTELVFANQDRIEKMLREIRKEAMESKKQTPDQTAYTLKAGSRLRSRLKGARQEIEKYSKDMPADTKKQYMQNVTKLSRMIEGQPTSPNSKTEYKSDFTPRNLAGQTYKAGATALGRKETTGDRYMRVQRNLLNKKSDKMAGKDPGEEKFKKGGVVKKKAVKKKSIDGIAKRGKTKLKRVKG